MTARYSRAILFLDVDGVLNSRAYVERGGSLNCRTDGIDPLAVVQLQRIVDESGCELVLSSTWRLIFSLADMRGKLIAAGMRHPVPLIDRTPDLASSNTAGSRAQVRGLEVNAWIAATGFTGRFVCVDDDRDFLPGQPLVQTTADEGLTAIHADKCIRILLGRAV